MKGNSSVQWVKTLLVYGLLAWISFFIASRDNYVLIWLPAGYSIYAMIRGNRFTLGAIFLGSAFFYGVMIYSITGSFASVTASLVGMGLFGIVEALNGLIGQILYERIRAKNNQETIRLGVVLIQVLILPSVISGFLYSFVEFNFHELSYIIVLSEWFSVSIAYFLGGSLLLPFYFYYHKEKNNILKVMHLEMRWTMVAVILSTLIISIYFWPKAFIGALFLAIVLLPNVNGSIGTALIIVLSLALANRLVIAADFSTLSVWQIYGALLIDVLSISIGFNLIIKLIMDHKMAINDLEDIIEERTEKMAICLERIEELSAYDQLTGTLNRRLFLERGEEEITRMKRYKRSLTLMNVDIDKIKTINDQHGYTFGDQVIMEISKICEANIRTSDLIARISGDEFAILMPETSESDAVIVAEKIRKAIAETPMELDSELSVTITASIGVTSCFEGIDHCMISADFALYRAKKSGRNKVILSSQL